MMILSVVIPIVGGEPIQPMLNAAIAPAVAGNTNSTLNSTIITGQQSAVLEDCKAFTFGISNTEFTSPLYPNNYPDNIDCVRVIAGKLVIHISFIGTLWLAGRQGRRYFC